jgi:hypothetical protein
MLVGVKALLRFDWFSSNGWPCLVSFHMLVGPSKSSLEKE